MSCVACGYGPTEGLSFCPQCGASLSPVKAEPAPEPKRVREPTLISDMEPMREARVVALLPDGSDGQAHILSGESMDFGREASDIRLAEDPYASPRHARLRCVEGAWQVQDLGSLNGVYLEIRDRVRIKHRDLVLMGQQVLRFEVLQDYEKGLGPVSENGVLLYGTPVTDVSARLCVVTTEGVVRDIHHLNGSELRVGRDEGEVRVSDDPFLSGLHAKVGRERETGEFYVEDLGSSNGTLKRIGAPETLHNGQRFRVGRSLFRFEATVMESGA